MAVLATLVASGWATTARAAEPAFIPACGGSSGASLKQDPRFWYPGCGDSFVQAGLLSWTGWGRATATAVGSVGLSCGQRLSLVFPEARCSPDSSPRTVRYPVRLEASGLRRCDGRATLPGGAARLYTRVRVSVRWPAENPFGMAPGWRAGRTLTTEDCDANQQAVVHMLGAFCEVGPDLPHPIGWQLGCVGYELVFRDLTWHRWGSASAVGVGRAPTGLLACFRGHHDPRVFPGERCTAPPTGAAIPQQDYPVRLIVSDIRRCVDGRGGRVPTYTRVGIQVRWPEDNPFGVAPGWRGGTPVTLDTVRPQDPRLDCV